jgi:pseudouridine-5'-phosphate glycosidase
VPHSPNAQTTRSLEKRIRAVGFYLTTFAALSGDIDDGK